MPVTEATLRSDPAWLERLAARLAAIDGRRLPAGEAAKLDSLRAWIARERAPHASGAWIRDTAPYLELGPRAVLEVAALPGAGPCARAKYATGRLRALPEVLRAARVTLRDLPLDGPGAAEAAAAPWRAAMDSLRALPGRLSGCREPVREADLVEADSLALAACERFVRFLREERGGIPGPGGRPE